MLIKTKNDITTSEITDEAVYQQCRDFMKVSAGLALIPVLGISLDSHAAINDYAGLNFTKKCQILD